MPTPVRVALFCLVGLMTCGQMACNLVPQRSLQQSQLRTRQLYEQNKALAMEREQSNQSVAALAAEKQRLANLNAKLERDINISNERLGNLNSERSQLQQRYASLLNRAKNQPNPLSAETTRRLEELHNKFPEFEFDPQTGVSKFRSDILFTSGSAQLKTAAGAPLREFAEILNSGEAQRLNILVVGHTDDKPIAKASTRTKHPTNWHLSTNRANSVVVALSKFGLKEARMGVAGYSMFQPVVPNKDSNTRQQNRRVEIFVLAPDAVVAGWDPGHSRK